MKVLHTSDWHAGKLWKGRSRLDELAAVLDDLAHAIERDRIDLVLMTGDIFDTPSPSADAERLVFGFFRRVGRLGTPSVVIAGNHDSPTRVEAWGQLAELAQVTTAGLPKVAARGGCVRVETRAGLACVAMVPFAPVARLVSAQQLGEAPERAPGRYAAEMRRLVARTCDGFEPGAVNLLLAHTHVEGARLAGTERRVHVTDDWAASVDTFPAHAQYVALGHVHLHQSLDAAAAPAWYAGSPMQLDFGEEGQGKAFNVVDVRPGQPARVEPRPYAGARPLRTITVSPDRMDVDPAQVADQPHVRVVVEVVGGPAPADINRRVRQAIPGVVSVDVRVTSPDAGARERLAPRTDGTLDPRGLYSRYHEVRHGSAPSPAVLHAFDDLLDAVHVVEVTS
ncbi:MAG TPA: exonuclease subunit SbcD [Luteitalea sp.]|nr:exonuclease subunit SbcD [Luteitalea sp.]